MPAQTMEQIVSLCKRRGFIFPGSSIYGGLQGSYDYGPLGVELKNNLKLSRWRRNGCKMRWRPDQIKGACPSCGSKDLTEPRPFNLMFKTQVGPVADSESFAY